jgi:hypothetical protein
MTHIGTYRWVGNTHPTMWLITVTVKLVGARRYKEKKNKKRYISDWLMCQNFHLPLCTPSARLLHSSQMFSLTSPRNRHSHNISHSSINYFLVVKWTACGANPFKVISVLSGSCNTLLHWIQMSHPCHYSLQQSFRSTNSLYRLLRTVERDDKSCLRCPGNETVLAFLLGFQHQPTPAHTRPHVSFDHNSASYPESIPCPVRRQASNNCRTHVLLLEWCGVFGKDYVNLTRQSAGPVVLRKRPVLTPACKPPCSVHTTILSSFELYSITYVFISHSLFTRQM